MEDSSATLYLLCRPSHRHPPISPFNHPFKHIFVSPTQKNGRMRLLRRLGEGPHGRKVIVLPMVLGLVLSPQFLHRQNRLAGLRPAMGEVTPHDLGLLFEPTGANAEDEAASREMIEGGNLFGQQQGAALGDQTNPGPEL